MAETTTYHGLSDLCRDFQASSAEFAESCAQLPDIPSERREALKEKLFGMCSEMISLARIEVYKQIQATSSTDT
jgi:hypothetical protein